MSQEMDGNRVAMVFFCGLAVFLVGALIGQCEAESRKENEAVKAGVADWIPSESGSPEFQWRKIENETKEH